jgi:hypothetical protein
MSCDPCRPFSEAATRNAIRITSEAIKVRRQDRSNFIHLSIYSPAQGRAGGWGGGGNLPHHRIFFFGKNKNLNKGHMRKIISKLKSI